MLATALELLGFACLAGFAFLVWPPATLLVTAAASFLVARAIA